MSKRVIVIPKKDEEELKRKKLRVAAYARVSMDSENQQSSIEIQKRYFKELINSNPNWKFSDLYFDEGITSLSAKKREGFNNIIKNALDGKIDHVITKSISRFARNTLDTVEIIRKLKEKEVSVYFQKENINALTSDGEFILTLMSSFTQEESRSISENVKWGCRKKYAEG